MTTTRQEFLAFHFSRNDTRPTIDDRRDAAIMYRAEWNRTHDVKPAQRIALMAPLKAVA